MLCSTIFQLSLGQGRQLAHDWGLGRCGFQCSGVGKARCQPAACAGYYLVSSWSWPVGTWPCIASSYDFSKKWKDWLILRFFFYSFNLMILQYAIGKARHNSKSSICNLCSRKKMCFEGFWGRNQGPWLRLQITKLWNMAGGLALNPELKLVSREFWLWVWLRTVSVFCYSELLKRGEALANKQRPLGTLLRCWM